VERSREPALNFLVLGPEARRWLVTEGEKDPLAVEWRTLDRDAEGEARALGMAIMAGILGKRLGSWDF
jgi:hypothetical protein